MGGLTTSRAAARGQTARAGGFGFSRPASRILKQIVPPILVVAALILLWYVSVSALKVPFYIFPTPLQVWRAFVARGWAYLPDVWTTMQEVLAGFALGVLIGVPLAVLMSWSRAFQRGVYPVLIGSQMVPLFAIAAVITVAFAQDGLLPQIVIAALFSFFPIVVTTTDGLSRVDPDLINLLRAAGASGWRILRTIRAPSALPAFFSGCKLAVTFAVGGAAIGEWIGGQSGLGYLMRFQNDSLLVPDMFATVVVLTLLGVTLFFAVGIVERIAVPWHRDDDSGLGNLWRAR